MTRPGLLLNGRYRLSDRIAAGGMGEVWRGTDELLGRDVAVKMLQHHYSQDPTFRTRFRGEAQYTARLTHPGIAQVYDYGEQDDLSFLVMELVSGQPLSEILARHGRLSADVTLDIVGQAARALHAAHLVGVMHRDIKPGNLMITHDGVVKLTDFGIARAVEAVTLTQTGTVMGTAQYVSPEQAAGRTLTPSTDIYSLGVVAYECLAGRPPFTADTAVTVALKHVREYPPPLPDDIPEPVQELVALAMEKDPATRPQSAAEFADRAHALRETLALGPTQALGGASALPSLLAGGSGQPDSAVPTGTDPLAASPHPAPTAPGAATAAAAETARQPVSGDETRFGEFLDDEERTGAGGKSRRKRRGAALAVAAVLVLASALVLGALWQGGDQGADQRDGRQTQATDEPSPVRAVPPTVPPSPTYTPERTAPEPPPRREPGGNIDPRPSDRGRSSPTADAPDPAETSPQPEESPPTEETMSPPADQQSSLTVD